MLLKHLGKWSPKPFSELPRFFVLLYTMKLENCQCVCIDTRESSSIWPCNVRKCYSSSAVVGNELVTTLKKPGLKTLWRKIKREKRRFLSPSPGFHFQYDLNSYSQNFDDGYCNDPDNVSRSFSARFAVPSKIFDKTQTVVDDGNHKDKSNKV